jgi:hypothetical protein
MLHGREYNKKILGVSPPMGRASGPPAGLIGARVSRQRPSLPTDAAHVSRTSTTPHQSWCRRHDRHAALPCGPASHGYCAWTLC